jgi:hypothetical protein
MMFIRIEGNSIAPDRMEGQGQGHDGSAFFVYVKPKRKIWAALTYENDEGRL